MSSLSATTPMRSPLAHATSALFGIRAPAPAPGLLRCPGRNGDRCLRTEHDAQFGEQNENLAYLGCRLSRLHMRNEFGRQSRDVDQVITREPLSDAGRANNVAKRRNVRYGEIRLIHRGALLLVPDRVRKISQSACFDLFVSDRERSPVKITGQGQLVSVWVPSKSPASTSIGEIKGP